MPMQVGAESSGFIILQWYLPTYGLVVGDPYLLLALIIGGKIATIA